SVTLNPDDNQLPIFFGGDDDSDPAFYNFTGRENTYSHYILDKIGDKEGIPSSKNILSNIGDLSSEANGKQSSEEIEAGTYDTLIE
ncbi:MAG: hypothetical protein AAB946_01350, partial [Patescibacteria group bacterium]